MNNRDNLKYLKLQLIKGSYTQKKEFLKNVDNKVKETKKNYYIKSNLERGNFERVNQLKN